MKPWEIMKAFEEGAEIESRLQAINPGDWGKSSNPIWNWHQLEYRVKPAEPEVDWRQVPIDTQIICSNKGNDENYRRYFAGIKNGKPSVWANGASSHTALTPNSVTTFDSMKLDQDAKSLIHWIPNTGVLPRYDLVLIKMSTGSVTVTNPRSIHTLNWKLDATNPVTHYAILEG